NGLGKRPRGRPRKHPPPSSSSPDAGAGADSYAYPPSAAATKNESDEEDEGSVEVAEAYYPAEFPELALDVFDVLNRSEYAGSFVRPLVDDLISALEIAYSHRQATANERAKAQRRKNKVLNECNKLRARYQKKRLELSLAHDTVREKSRDRGQKNSEDNGDNDDRDVNDPAGDSGGGGIGDEEAVTPQPDEGPPTKKRRGLHKNKRYLRDYPHRVEVLTSLGVAFEPHCKACWEGVF
ncbi:hypothetical protein ACHAWF_003417, partial [Thalassiosira exigua]